MKKYTQEELKLILEKHKKLINDEEGGEQANLSSVDLSFADLRSADLRYANLSSANLRYADLSYADLRYADLSYADLSYANLSSANLSYANLSFANLSSANLRYADLSYADLSSANLRFADLSYADLNSANLSYAVSDLKFISLSCLGSSRRMTTYCFEYDTIWCGCFKGTLEEFEQKVNETHKDNKQYLKEYLGAINYIRSLKED